MTDKSAIITLIWRRWNYVSIRHNSSHRKCNHTVIALR